MNKYIIIPFLIINYDTYSVVQNYKNLCVIKNASMINLLNHVDRNYIRELDDSTLIEYLGTNCNKAVDFMLSNFLIEKKAELNLNWKNVEVYSNDATFKDSFDFNSKGVSFKLRTSLLNSDYDNIDFDQNEEKVYIFFLNPFNYKKFVSLEEIIKNKNILVRFAFYYNNKIYISNYYKKEWYVPCPLCYFSHIEATLRAQDKMTPRMTFQSIVDLIYKEDPSFEIENKFTNKDMLLLVNTLIHDLEKLNNNNINIIKSIDFANDEIMCDNAVHWEICDCYE